MAVRGHSDLRILAGVQCDLRKQTLTYQGGRERTAEGIAAGSIRIQIDKETKSRGRRGRSRRIGHQRHVRVRVHADRVWQRRRRSLALESAGDVDGKGSRRSLSGSARNWQNGYGL